MSIEKLLLIFLLLAPAGGCLDWSLDGLPSGPVDCTRIANSDVRYPDVCGVDAAVSSPDAGAADLEPAD